jgi:hypothetical protein
MSKTTIWGEFPKDISCQPEIFITETDESGIEMIIDSL